MTHQPRGESSGRETEGVKSLCVRKSKEKAGKQTQRPEREEGKEGEELLLLC